MIKFEKVSVGFFLWYIIIEKENSKLCARVYKNVSDITTLFDFLVYYLIIGDTIDNNKILDIIIDLLEGINNNGRIISNNSECCKMELKGCNYLLNQTIRQLVLPNSLFSK